jgi:calcineurin-like phosphoesterase family protein
VGYLIADLHLGHEAVLGYADRPFASVAEMNERLVERWNSVVDDGRLVGIVTLDDLLVLLDDGMSDLSEVIRNESPSCEPA